MTTTLQGHTRQTLGLPPPPVSTCPSISGSQMLRTSFQLPQPTSTNPPTPKQKRRLPPKLLPSTLLGHMTWRSSIGCPTPMDKCVRLPWTFGNVISPDAVLRGATSLLRTATYSSRLCTQAFPVPELTSGAQTFVAPGSSQLMVPRLPPLWMHKQPLSASHVLADLIACLFSLTPSSPSTSPIMVYLLHPQRTSDISHTIN
jgi:hypothetical protein